MDFESREVVSENSGVSVQAKSWTWRNHLPAPRLAATVGPKCSVTQTDGTTIEHPSCPKVAPRGTMLERPTVSRANTIGVAHIGVTMPQVVDPADRTSATFLEI